MKSPAFQLYAADFYMDTVSWSATEVGAYFRLLMHEWVNGPLPNNMNQLARIAGIDVKTMKASWEKSFWDKFVPARMTEEQSVEWENSRHSCTGKFPSQNEVPAWENSRLERTRQEQAEYREKQVESGRKGGLTTQEQRRTARSEPSSKASSENEALQSSSSRKNNKKKCVAPSPDVKAAIDYFSQTTEAAKGFKPKVAAKDAAAVKRCLKTQPLEDIKAQIDFFLGNGKSREHISLSASLSADTYNLFMAKKAEVIDPLGGLAY